MHDNKHLIHHILVHSSQIYKAHNLIYVLVVFIIYHAYKPLKKSRIEIGKTLQCIVSLFVAFGFGLVLFFLNINVSQGLDVIYQYLLVKAGHDIPFSWTVV